MLNMDYFEIKDEVNYKNLIYTGPIDYFFNYCFGNLPYRSLEFIQKTYNMECYIINILIWMQLYIDLLLIDKINY